MKIRHAVAAFLVCACLVLPLAPRAQLKADASMGWAALTVSDFSKETLMDVAVSPDYAQDHTIYVLTYTIGFSLWRTQDGAATWQKVFVSGSGQQINSIALSPQYGQAAQVVYLLGSVDGSPRLWRSQDGGLSWTSPPRVLPDGTAGTNPFAVVSDTSLFVTGYDSVNNQAYVYFSSNSGLVFSAGTPAGNLPINSIKLSPDYADDATVLLGNYNGGVFWSTDGGSTFKLMPYTNNFIDRMSVAFDPAYATNHTVYAASFDPSGGVYSNQIGTLQQWQRLDVATPAGGLLGAVTASSDGVLYVTSARPVYSNSSQGGLLRCLSPGSSPFFERVVSGLSNGAVLMPGVLECVGNQLWAIDSANNQLITLVDTLSRPVNLLTPADGATDTGTLSGSAVSGVFLVWQAEQGASTYQWQVSLNSDFSTIPTGFSGETAATTALAPALLPASSYYWRVRVDAPFYSPWSVSRSFSTPAIPVELGVPQLLSPLSGSGTALQPLFQWTSVSGAGGYELVVSTSSDVSSPFISLTGASAVSGTSWQCDTTLQYSTAYYWRVRAVAGTSSGEWSATGIFVTQNEPVPTSTLPPVTTSTLPPATTAPPTTTTLPPTTTVPPTTTAAPTTTAPQVEGETPVWIYYVLVGVLAVIIVAGAVVLIARWRNPRRR